MDLVLVYESSDYGDCVIEVAVDFLLSEPYVIRIAGISVAM